MAATGTRGKRSSSSDPTPTPGLGLGWGPPTASCKEPAETFTRVWAGGLLPPPLTPQMLGQGWGCWVPGSLQGPPVRAQMSGAPRGQGPKVQTPKSREGSRDWVGGENRGKARAPGLQNQVLWGGSQIPGKVGGQGRGTEISLGVLDPTPAIVRVPQSSGHLFAKPCLHGGGRVGGGRGSRDSVSSCHN